MPKGGQKMLDLEQFTGSEQNFITSLGIDIEVITEGVKYLIENTDIKQALNVIFASIQANPTMQEEGFLVIRLIQEPKRIFVKIEDGNDNILDSFPLDKIELPKEQLDLWYVNNTLLLPSEY